MTRRRATAQLDKVRRMLVRLAVTAEWVPVDEFAAMLHAGLGMDAFEWDDVEGASVRVWRAARRDVLDDLRVLGLAGWVTRVDATIPLESHEFDLAGLVRIGQLIPSLVVGEPPTPADPPIAWPAPSLDDRYQAQMFEVLGLRAVYGLPSTLRGFVGQCSSAQGTHDYRLATYEYRPYNPRWTDHARAWLDRWGDPVLTCEPYGDLDLMTVVRDVEGLGLWVERHPGLWIQANPAATTLLVWRYNPDAEVPPATYAARRWSRSSGEFVAAR